MASPKLVVVLSTFAAISFQNHYEVGTWSVSVQLVGLDWRSVVVVANSY